MQSTTPTPSTREKYPPSFRKTRGDRRRTRPEDTTSVAVGRTTSATRHSTSTSRINTAGRHPRTPLSSRSLGSSREGLPRGQTLPRRESTEERALMARTRRRSQMTGAVAPPRKILPPPNEMRQPGGTLPAKDPVTMEGNVLNTDWPSRAAYV